MMLKKKFCYRITNEMELQDELSATKVHNLAHK